MNLDNTIMVALTAYQLPAIFIGSFFFGETVIITAAFLAAQGLWSPLTVFWLALTGTLFSDALWFWFGQKLLLRLHRWERYKTQSAQLLSTLEKITGRRPFLALLFIKFLYGTRILTILYLSTRRLKLLTFLLFDTIGSAIWLIVMIAIGWFAGKSLVDLMPALNTFEYTALLVTATVLLVRFGTIWLSQKITKA